MKKEEEEEKEEEEAQFLTVLSARHLGQRVCKLRRGSSNRNDEQGFVNGRESRVMLRCPKVEKVPGIPFDLGRRGDCAQDAGRRREREEKEEKGREEKRRK